MASFPWWAFGSTPASVRPFPSEIGRLFAVGRQFHREDGSVFGWRGATWFLGFARYLRGEDVRPDLERFVGWGVNIVRVFLRVPWGGEWEFYRDPHDFPALRRFIALVSEHGLRTQLVALTYADAPVKQQQRVQEAYDVAYGFPLATVQVANEPHVNGIDTALALQGVDKRGVLSCSGDYYAVSASGEVGDGVLPPAPFSVFPLTLDYGDLHTERNSRYPRNGKEPREFADVSGVPWIDGEPWGFGEHPVSGGGSRTTDIQAAVGHHGTAQLMCAGSCLHTQAGLEGRAPDPVTEPIQTAMCEAVSKVWQFFPEHVYTGEYSRPHLSNWPLEWRDDDSDSQTGHAYASLLGTVAYACVPLPRVGWHAVGVNGWTVTDQIIGYPGVVKLER